MHIPVRTLLIDNYDSYTYNLFQLIAEVSGIPPDVVFNDAISWEDLSHRIASGQYHNIVISPGPGTPHCAADIGVCKQLLQAEVQIPVLGVCLGMQALAVTHGATVRHAPEPIHGRLSHIKHTGHKLFQDMPSGADSSFAVVRYHSLAVDEATLPACLKAIAWTCGAHTSLRAAPDVPQVADNGKSCLQKQPSSAADTVVQAIAHTRLPLCGVQFHPESVGTAFGRQLLYNFAAITAEWHVLQSSPLLSKPLGSVPSALPAATWQQANGPPSLEVKAKKLEGLLKAMGGAESVFMHLFGSQDAQDTFWLDSSASDRGRFSYMGGRGGPLWQRLTYQLPLGNSPPGPTSCSSNQQQTCGTITLEDAQGRIATHQMSLWVFLKQQLEAYRIQSDGSTAEQLPFDFCGGLMGYLGYELKAELGGENAHQAATPDAAMFLADRLIAIDHLHSNIYLIALASCNSSSSHASAQDWLQATENQLQGMLPGKRAFSKASAAKADPAVELTNDDMSQLSCQTQHHMNTVSSSTLSDEDMLDDEQAYLSNSRSYRGRPAQSSSASTVSASTTFGLGANATASGSHSQQAPYRCTDNQQATDRCTDSQHPSHACTDTSQASHRHTDAAEMVASAPSPFKLARSRQQYLRDVEACQKALHDGDSYEICLTTALVREHSVDPLQLYRTLRRVNPAPYAAWLSFGGAEEHQICCASPERFLKGGRGGTLEAKPIKGTAPRFPDAAQDRASALALASSEKDQAENLMIVDLLRNDLGRVCQVGSVHVPTLMEVESFATVHQLVSTVRGRRQSDKSIIDCIQAAFPGGSMTGAPKIRSMQILDSLEKQARGVYSGSLGFIGFNDTFDLNIVIRTAVMHNGKIRIGAGGAIVVQSDPEGEYDEMRLKASALLKAVALSSNEPVCPAEVDAGEA